MEEFSLVILGAIFGSFLNMLIYRLPLGISLFNPKRSTCTTCKHTISWYENIPILSYIYLRGKCSGCKETISISYPIVEFITALVTLLLFNKLGLTSEFAATAFLFYTLIVLSFIDFKYKAVPDYLLLVLLLITFFIVFSFYYQDNLIAMFIFAGAFSLLEFTVTFYIQNIKARILNDEELKDQKSMGEGDIPIAAIIGGLLGIKLGIVAVFLAAVFAIIPSLINSIIKKDIETPFIPYLALGLFCVFIYQDYLLILIGN